MTSVTATGTVPGARAYRNDRIPAEQTGGIAVLAARTDLLATVGATVRSGAWLNEATAPYPAVVLGEATARLLGIGAAGPDVQVWLGGQWFTVVGILDPVALAPELDTAALVGWPAAQRPLGFDGHPGTVYTRCADEAVTDVRSVLARTANPQRAEEASISRPSDALAAANAADETFTGLLLGLGGVALLVGGVGVVGSAITTEVITVTRTTTAIPDPIWDLCADVPRRTRWDEGLEWIRINGPFETGATGEVKVTDQRCQHAPAPSPGSPPLEAARISGRMTGEVPPWSGWTSRRGIPSTGWIRVERNRTRSASLTVSVALALRAIARTPGTGRFCSL